MVLICTSGGRPWRRRFQARDRVLLTCRWGSPPWRRRAQAIRRVMHVWKHNANAHAHNAFSDQDICMKSEMDHAEIFPRFSLIIVRTHRLNDSGSPPTFAFFSGGGFNGLGLKCSPSSSWIRFICSKSFSPILFLMTSPEMFLPT